MALSPLDWLKIKKEIVDHVLVTKGELDTEYKRLVDATAEWDKRNNLPALQAVVDKGNAELAAAKQTFETFKTNETARLTKWVADLQAKEKALAASLKAHADDKSQLQADKEAHAAAKLADAKALDAEHKALAMKQAEVSDLQNSLHTRDVSITARESKVQGIMSKLSAEWLA